jgi:hypothetical protein
MIVRAMGYFGTELFLFMLTKSEQLLPADIPAACRNIGKGMA